MTVRWTGKIVLECSWQEVDKHTPRHASTLTRRSNLQNIGVINLIRMDLREVPGGHIALFGRGLSDVRDACNLMKEHSVILDTISVGPLESPGCREYAWNLLLQFIHDPVLRLYSGIQSCITQLYSKMACLPFWYVLF